MMSPVVRLVLTVILLAALLVTPDASHAQAEPVSAPGETPLEVLAEAATRAVVLIDVRTAADSRQGSGFLIDPGGLILTNHHVIRDARSARVKLASGDVYEQVSVRAQDPRRDIAIIEIPGFGLPTLPLGNSDSVRIGAPVVLIGSPLGLENTVSTGIVSGRRQEQEGFQLLQVTAPASRGSSGGAVLSQDGRVVGVASSQLRTGQNLNFAVPINYARGLLQHLGQEPVTVLAAGNVSLEEGPLQPTASHEVVNVGMAFDLGDLRSLVLESTEELPADRSRRTRVTYRVIETIGGGPPRLERYSESETTRGTEPFGTRQTIRRERVRSLVRLSDLSPLESTGQVERWSDGGWSTWGHGVRFEGDRVVGVVSDSAGKSLELDRTVPSGILLRNLTDLAFATLVADSLVGLSVEFATFDPGTGEVTHDRFDVLGRETVRALEDDRRALRVNVATGLDNETVHFAADPPRIPLMRRSHDGTRLERTTRVERIPRGPSEQAPSPGGG